MNRKLLTGCAALLVWHAVAAQDSLKVWTLQTCLDYALENNIQLQQSRNDYLSGLEDTREAKAALLPSLAVSATQGYTNYPSSNAEDNNSYTGTYGINAGLTLYEGGKLRTAVKEQRLQNRIDALSVAESANDIRIAIVEAYMQALYAAEAVEVAAGTAEVSRAQRDRARADVAGGIDQQGRFRPARKPVCERPLPSSRRPVVARRLQVAAQTAARTRHHGGDESCRARRGRRDRLAGPARQNRHLRDGARRHAADRTGAAGRRDSGVGIREARAGFYPSVSLTAGLGTGHMSGGGFQSGSQVWNRFNENVGLSVSIPIFSNRQEPDGRQQGAHRRGSSSRLDQLGSAQRTLLREVESAYLDAVSAQSR